ncbi:hypothetical protein ACPV5O_26760 [Vibrio maritimus]|uniref:hypothetical protein n=1 Tax=Vibrio maritimus TaxID=990268 RepID=UPI004068BFEB
MRVYVSILTATTTAVTSFYSFADPATSNEIQDMSDPLAVYTQVGSGLSDKGVNVKVGRSYNTGNPDTMAMNIIEVKGVAGEYLGWSGTGRRDNSIDSIRFRNFSVTAASGRGTQFDVNYDVEHESLNASYSFIQALPKLDNLSLYPLAGMGINVRNGNFRSCADTSSLCQTEQQDYGYTVPGTYAIVGMYGKYAITDKLWLNYNPMWLTTLSGSKSYVDNAYGVGKSSILTHELAMSYQFTHRFNVRYFANWTQGNSYFEGDQRVEFNYQL